MSPPPGNGSGPNTLAGAEPRKQSTTGTVSTAPPPGNVLQALGLTATWTAVFVQHVEAASLVRMLGYRCAAVADAGQTAELLRDPGREPLLVGTRAMMLADDLQERGYEPWYLHLPAGVEDIDDYLSRIDLASRANGITGALSPEAQLHEFDHLTQAARLFDIGAVVRRVAAPALRVEVHR